MKVAARGLFVVVAAGAIALFAEPLRGGDELVSVVTEKLDADSFRVEISENGEFEYHFDVYVNGTTKLHTIVPADEADIEYTEFSAGFFQYDLKRISDSIFPRWAYRAIGAHPDLVIQTNRHIVLPRKRSI